MRETREIVKLLLFTIIWGMPILVSMVWVNQWLLLLFIVSAFMSSSIFRHYEVLDSLCSKEKDETDADILTENQEEEN